MRSGKGLEELANRAGPVAIRRLAEKAHGGVPGRIAPVEHPAPIGGVGEEDPGRSCQRAGKVGYDGIDADNKVEGGHQGSGVGEVMKFVGPIDQREGGGLGGGGTFLETHEVKAGTLSQGSKRGERKGTLAIPGVGGVAAPGQADGCAGSKLRQPLLPAEDIGRIGMEIGGGTRQGFHGRVEEEGKACQRKLEVKRRERCALADHLRHTGRRLRQAHGRRRARDQHASDARGGHGGKADELEGIAEALFGMKQERLARRRAAIPARLAPGVRSGGEVGEPPAPLVVAPPFQVIAPKQEGKGQIAVEAGGLGAEFEGAAVAGDGLVGPSGVELGAGAVGVEFGQVRRKRQGVRIGGDGGVVMAGLKMHAAEIAPAGDVIGLAVDGLLEEGEGFLETAEGSEGRAEIIEGGQMAGAEGEALAKEGNGVDSASLLKEGEAEHMQGFGIIGMIGEPEAIIGLSEGKPSGAMVRQGLLQEGIGIRIGHEQSQRGHRNRG